jgi:hypothetical protein
MIPDLPRHAPAMSSFIAQDAPFLALEPCLEMRHVSVMRVVEFRYVRFAVLSAKARQAAFMLRNGALNARFMKRHSRRARTLVLHR